MEKLFIPKKIKVGYQERSDTYTKRLAYVIYYDAKGKLRKETSWLGWCHIEDEYYDDYIRDKKFNVLKDENGQYRTERKLSHKGLGSDEFDNVPTEGFVLNKGVGGQRQSWGWNARNEYIRVFDPRGFEFEISVANLLYILQECTSTKGKGLEGQFVYSWDGKELLLLPVDTYEYEMSADFTKTQSKKIDRKDLIPGHKFQFKDLSEAIYIGFYTHNALIRRERYYNVGSKQEKAHIFYDIKNKEYFKTSGLTKIAGKIDTDQPENWATLLTNWEKKPLFSKIVSFEWAEKNLVTNNLQHQYYSYQAPIYVRAKDSDEVFAMNIFGNDRGTYSWYPSYIGTKIRQKNFRIENNNIVHDAVEEDGPKFQDINCTVANVKNRFDILQPIVTLDDGTSLNYSIYLERLKLTSK